MLKNNQRKRDLGIAHYPRSRKKEVCKKKREAYALKKALAKKAIRNEHMVMTPTMGTSKVTDAHAQTDCNDEKGIEKGVHGRKRKQCVIISEDKKEKLHEKKREACAHNSVDSRKCSQNRGVGIVINEGSARISGDY